MAFTSALTSADLLPRRVAQPLVANLFSAVRRGLATISLHLLRQQAALQDQVQHRRFRRQVRCRAAAPRPPSAAPRWRRAAAAARRSRCRVLPMRWSMFGEPITSRVNCWKTKLSSFEARSEPMAPIAAAPCRCFDPVQPAPRSASSASSHDASSSWPFSRRTSGARRRSGLLM